MKILVNIPVKSLGIMLKKLGIGYVLIGHSERRNKFKETNEEINKKILKGLNIGMKPILCVGENEEEKRSDSTFSVVKTQLEKALLNVDDISNLKIAYEPVWAIGTGNTCSADEAEKVIIYIKNIIKEKYNKDVPVFYGGSVNPASAKEFLEKNKIDGVLVGGSSLDPIKFEQIINSI